MRKFIYGLFLFSLLLSVGSCSETPITFEDELPQFELKSDAILLEVIMPKGTTNDDEYYIAGEFNGGDEAAVDNPEWLLEKATNSDSKWGIYLYPSSFKNGKTLADGFHFVAKNKGEERTVKNEPVTRHLDVTVGSRTNVWVDRWASYFDEPEEGNEHDGFVIYVDDQSGWDNLYLYGWDGNGDVMAAWPGISITGTEVIDGVTYKYFDLGESLNNREGVNLIFNNNDGTQFDGPSVTFDRNFYFRITASGYEEINSTPQEESYTVYVADQSGWDNLYLYGWDGDGDVMAAWPGMPVTGTEVINGVTYKYFDLGVELNNREGVNLIFNNNDGSQFDGPAVTFNRDYYFRITGSSYEEIDPSAQGESYTIYVDDQSGWEALAIYGWGDNGDVTPGWPGVTMSGTQDIDGTSYKVFPMPSSASNCSMNLIFNNNNGGMQFDGPNILLDRDYYFRITSDACEEVTTTN